jgi:hypothetical protein
VRFWPDSAQEWQCFYDFHCHGLCSLWVLEHVIWSSERFVEKHTNFKSIRCTFQCEISHRSLSYYVGRARDHRNLLMALSSSPVLSIIQTLNPDRDYVLMSLSPKRSERRFGISGVPWIQILWLESWIWQGCSSKTIVRTEMCRIVCASYWSVNDLSWREKPHYTEINQFIKV